MSMRSKGWVTTAPRDIKIGPGPPESVPEIPPRARVTMRAKAKWETCAETGKADWVDRWDIGLVDITGNQGLGAQFNGRTSGPVTD
ncbi:hypothetical protein O4215_12935 [Rhodococcus maanshanensis]|nr:hypothetical protein [Rhodococcus maanshanensis]MCZ4556478.1 hypothetical protein [Rhodococcus maanshanensis]